jgi:hypothetical protein
MNVNSIENGPRNARLVFGNERQQAHTYRVFVDDLNNHKGRGVHNRTYCSSSIWKRIRFLESYLRFLFKRNEILLKFYLQKGVIMS